MIQQLYSSSRILFSFGLMSVCSYISISSHIPTIYLPSFSMLLCLYLLMPYPIFYVPPIYDHKSIIIISCFTAMVYNKVSVHNKVIFSYLEFLIKIKYFLKICILNVHTLLNITQNTRIFKKKIMKKHTRTCFIKKIFW